MKNQNSSEDLQHHCLSPFGTITKYYKLGDFKKTNIYSSVLKSRKSKVKVPADLVSGEHLLPGSQTAIFSLCPDF